MLIIPFPVCAYATIYYRNGRRLILVVSFFYNKLRHLHKQEMELLTCGPISFYMCQLLNDLQRVRTSLPS